MAVQELKVTPESIAETARRVVDTALPTPRDDGRQVEENFDILPTHIPGFSLLVEHGTSADSLSRSDTEKLQKIGGPYVLRDRAKKELERRQTKPQIGEYRSPHDQIEDLAINNKGVRGGRDRREGWEVQVNPQIKDILNPDLIRASGEAAAEYVHRQVAITIFLDPDVDDVKAEKTSAHRRLRRSGYSEEQIKEMLKVSESVRIDAVALLNKVDSGEIVLLPGAHEEQIANWSVVPRVIATDADRALVEEAVVGNSQTSQDETN